MARAPPRVYYPPKTAYLTIYFVVLEAAGMMDLNTQSTCSSVAIAMTRGSGFRVVANYRATIQFIEQAAMPISRWEELELILKGAAAFSMRDIVQGLLADAVTRIGPGALHVNAGAARNRNRYSVLPGDHGDCAKWDLWSEHVSSGRMMSIFGLVT